MPFSRAAADVHDVVACRQYADEAHVRAGVKRFPRDRRLIGVDDIRVAYALRDAVGARPVVHRQFAESGQSIPGQIAGIFRITVEYYDF
jgi:hypothetical protein